LSWVLVAVHEKLGTPTHAGGGGGEARRGQWLAQWWSSSGLSYLTVLPVGKKKDAVKKCDTGDEKKTDSKRGINQIFCRVVLLRKSQRTRLGKGNKGRVQCSNVVLVPI
jgi:hypothetical protein